MARDITTRLADLRREIVALSDEEARLLKERAAVWPKPATLFVHMCEANYDQGKQLGLTGKALQAFVCFGHEIALDVLVFEDGVVQILGVDGRTLAN